MHAHMYDIHVTHMYVIPACMYVAAPWNEVKGARWLCGTRPVEGVSATPTLPWTR